MVDEGNDFTKSKHGEKRDGEGGKREIKRGKHRALKGKEGRSIKKRKERKRGSLIEGMDLYVVSYCFKCLFIRGILLEGRGGQRVWGGGES